jgi:O-antigen ligase
VTSNPHNQVLAVAIQLGLVGTWLIVAMWVVHLSLFAGPGLVCWLGIVVVLQNFVSSAFNTSLFDFTEGWIYVVCAGVLGGTLYGRRFREPHQLPSAPLPFAWLRKL